MANSPDHDQRLKSVTFRIFGRSTTNPCCPWRYDFAWPRRDGVDSYVERFGDLAVARYNYLYVGLPGLDAQEYLRRDIPLAVASSALMKLRSEHSVVVDQYPEDQLGKLALQASQVASLNDLLTSWQKELPAS